MNSLNDIELEQIQGGWTADGAITEFGAALAADGLKFAESSNPVVGGFGLIVAAAGGWTWAAGSAIDAIGSLFD